MANYKKRRASRNHMVPLAVRFTPEERDFLYKAAVVFSDSNISNLVRSALNSYLETDRFQPTQYGKSSVSRLREEVVELRKHIAELEGGQSNE